LVQIDKLVDENGEYFIADIFEKEINIQNEILEIKTLIRKDNSLWNTACNFDTIWLSQTEID
jgi:hypothetical protein